MNNFAIGRPQIVRMHKRAQALEQEIRNEAARIKKKKKVVH